MASTLLPAKHHVVKHEQATVIANWRLQGQEYSPQPRTMNQTKGTIRTELHTKTSANQTNLRLKAKIYSLNQVHGQLNHQNHQQNHQYHQQNHQDHHQNQNQTKEPIRTRASNQNSQLTKPTCA
ncbi:hypothetical protein WMY93_033617 [Mugilogobius chulae]|uniref:Uncharacterized protein n=1 Tax=Mugilogobius chulae TaxID=88201 RepID=A0AAW0MNC0_9GOBI